MFSSGCEKRSRSDERDVLRQAPVEDERLGLAVLGGKAHPAADRAAGAVGLQRLAVDEELALVRRVEPVDEAQQLGAPGADEPAEPDDLAGVDLEAHVADHRQAPGAAHLEQQAVRPDRPLGVQLLDLAADHVLDELVGRGRGRQAGRHRAAVGEHRHAIADAADLVEAMGDVDDADALGGEPADDLEQRLDLGVVEDRGRLVHDQQADVARQRSRDRDDLLRRRAQRADLRARGDRLVAEALEQRGRVAVHLVEVEQQPAARRGSCARKMLSATLRSGTRSSSW